MCTPRGYIITREGGFFYPFCPYEKNQHSRYRNYKDRELQDGKLKDVVMIRSNIHSINWIIYFYTFILLYNHMCRIGHDIVVSASEASNDWLMYYVGNWTKIYSIARLNQIYGGARSWTLTQYYVISWGFFVDARPLDFHTNSNEIIIFELKYTYF